MKSLYLTLCALFFFSQNTLLANDPIEAEDIVTEDVIQEEVIQEEIIEEEIPQEIIQEELAEEVMEEEALAEEPIEENMIPGTATAEEISQEADPDAPSEAELEAAHAEEAELREMGAGEEPVIEE